MHTGHVTSQYVYMYNVICVWLGLSVSFQSSVFLFSPLITDLFLKFMGELYPQQAISPITLRENQAYMYSALTGVTCMAALLRMSTLTWKHHLIIKDLLKANWYMCGFIHYTEAGGLFDRWHHGSYKQKCYENLY